MQLSRSHLQRVPRSAAIGTERISDDMRISLGIEPPLSAGIVSGAMCVRALVCVLAGGAA